MSGGPAPPLSIVVLAAGQGKRMKSDLPKVLQPLASRPLLAHVVDAARELGPADLCIVYGHGGERVQQAFAADCGSPALRWALQAEQLGTGHAVAQALPGIPDDHRVLVLYGDVPLIRTATLVALLGDPLDHPLDHPGDPSLRILSVMLDDPRGYGRVIRDNAGTVVRIVEEKDANTKERAIREGNSGLLAAPARLLRGWLARLGNDNAQGEYYLTDIVSLAVRDGVKVHAIVVPEASEVQGVNDKVQLAELEAVLRRQRATALMHAGVTLADPARITLRGEVTAGRDVFVDANVTFVGRVTLGDRVRIGPNCYIEDCEIGSDTELLPNCVAVGAKVHERCIVGPFARLRPGTVLGDEVHVGNFVEVKNAELGPGSKANHLTYLGDASVGSRVNIGAGTITCNYDGVNKSRTEIGDGSFIGSGTMLVAPVKIGAEASIGAGSTITRDAPAGKLTLARTRQATIEGWRRPVKKKK